MDEPVPVRSAAIGCLLIAVGGMLALLVVRPAIFTFAPPRGDEAVIVASATDVAGNAVRREVVLTRSRGWDGEVDAGDGRVQLSLIVSSPTIGAAAVVNGASPVADDCPLDIGPDRLTDCDDRQWTYAGVPLDPADPPLERFPAQVSDGSVVVDLTRLLGG